MAAVVLMVCGLLLAAQLGPRAAGAAEARACPPGNLLEGRAPLWQVAVSHAAALTDGVLPRGRGPADPPEAAEFEFHLSTAVYDLGAVLPIRSAFLRAEDRVGYEVAGSIDGANWEPVWRSRASGANGRRIRRSPPLDAEARYLRLDPLGGDEPHRVSEFQVFCRPADAPVARTTASREESGWSRLPRTLRSPLTPVALAVLVSLGAAFLLSNLLAGRRLALRADGRAWRSASIALVLLAFALVSLTFRDYGFNVDENIQMKHGIFLADWYSSLFSDLSYRSYDSPIPQLNFYGGFFDTLAEFSVRVSAADRVSTRHLVTALFGILALVGVYLLGAGVHSRAAGFLAAVFLLLTPRYYGHLFSNPKDVPFAVCYVFSILLIAKSASLFPRVPLRWVLATGASIGALVGTRVGGSIAIAYLGLACGWWLVVEFFRSGRRPLSDLADLLGSCVLITLCAWAVMLIFWPWAQSGPIEKPLNAILYYRDITRELAIDFGVFFEGRDYLLSTVPSHFTLRWLLISMPEFWPLAVLGIFPAIRWICGGGLRARSSQTDGMVLIALATGLPLLTTFATRVIQFDGVRHFLFVLPLLSVLLSVSLVSFLRSPAPKWLRLGAIAACVALGAVTAADMVRLHPYEYVYFNRTFGGGLKEGAKRFETDYLGLSYREGVEWVLERYFPARRAQTRIASCPGFEPNLDQALAGAPRRAAEFSAVAADQSPHLVVAFTREHCHRYYRGRVIFTVARDDTPLLYVIEGRGG